MPEQGAQATRNGAGGAGGTAGAAQAALPGRRWAKQSRERSWRAGGAGGAGALAALLTMQHVRNIDLASDARFDSLFRLRDGLQLTRRSVSHAWRDRPPCSLCGSKNRCVLRHE